LLCSDEQLDWRSLSEKGNLVSFGISCNFFLSFWSSRDSLLFQSIRIPLLNGFPQQVALLFQEAFLVPKNFLSSDAVRKVSNQVADVSWIRICRPPCLEGQVDEIGRAHV
jgi:hypothetical protein